jgi:hypothetical protein
MTPTPNPEPVCPKCGEAQLQASILDGSCYVGCLECQSWRVYLDVERPEVSAVLIRLALEKDKNHA